MGALNLYKALRLIALRDVLEEPSEYHLRHIFRWYSRTFHVPLPDVPDLPLDHVLQAFYETKYEDMEEDQREEERQSLIETEVQRFRRLMEEQREAVDQVEFARLTDSLAEKQGLEADAKAQANAAKPLAPIAPGPKPLPQPSLELPQVGERLPPNIKMTFASEDEFARRLEGSGMEEPDDARDGNLSLKPAPAPTPKIP